MLSSALWLRLGVGAGQWGPHFSGEGLGGIEKEGKAKEALIALRLLGWGRANKAGSVRVGVGGLACTDNLKDGGGGVGVCVSHHPKPSVSPNNPLSQTGQPLFSDPGFSGAGRNCGGWVAGRELDLRSTITLHPPVVQPGTLKNNSGGLEKRRADQLGRASKPILCPHLAPGYQAKWVGGYF